MPGRETIEKAARDKREGKAPSTQAGEFIRKEIEHIRHGVHGARSAKQAIAIGLSEARRAGIDIPSRREKQGAGRKSGSRKAGTGNSASSRKRARASLKALRREGTRAASRNALSRFAKANARKRGAAQRSQSAKRVARTRG